MRRGFLSPGLFPASPRMAQPMVAVIRMGFWRDKLKNPLKEAPEFDIIVAKKKHKGGISCQTQKLKRKSGLP